MKHKAKGKMPTTVLTAQNQSAIKTADEFVRHVRHIGGRAPDHRYLDDGWLAPVLLLYLMVGLRRRCARRSMFRKSSESQ